MSSPFPGMDPFLEEAALWSSVHARLINAISDQLTSRLLPDFYVEIEQRIYVVEPDLGRQQQIIPDVYLVFGPKAGAPPVAAAEIMAPVIVEPQFETEIRERYLIVRDAQQREVVATIELLSPYNKQANSRGREAFLNKRRSVLASPVHWLEIDLLRGGERPDEVAGLSNYYVLLNRGGQLGPYEVWYFDLRDKLPTVALPLTADFEDAPLDLQAAFEDMYRRAGYGVSVDYSRPVPPPPLRPAIANWVNQQLVAAQSG